MKRAKGGIDGMNPKAYFDWLLDHTVVVAEDDPFLNKFKEMEYLKIIQLRVVPATGAEKFAEFLYHKIQAFIDKETDGRVRIAKIEFYEHSKNSAIYSPEIAVPYE